MATLASLVVKISGDTGQLVSSLEAAERRAQGFGGNLKKLTPIALGVGTSLAGVGVAAGAGLLKLGQNFDAAFDTIQTATGAAGSELEGLKDTFKDVFSDVPTDMASASKAVAMFAQRTDLSNETVEDLSKNAIQLSRLLGGDLETDIAGATRAMADWGITNEDAAVFLDELFVAAQKTGVGIGTLTEQLVKYGAPLRQLGFTQKEATALLAKFEKEGVNAELVLGSMRVALGKMAKAGEPAVETFKRVTEEIKRAGSTSEANAKALELFGARAGPDMAAAIREGRFELGSLVTDLQNADGAIADTAAATEDFGEKWTRLKNKMLVKLEPLAARTLDELNEFFTLVETKIAPAVEEWYTRHQPEINAKLEEFARIMDEDVNPAMERTAAVIERVWPKIEPIVTFAVNNIVTGVLQKFENMFNAINVLFAVFEGDWSEAWDRLKEIGENVFGPMVDAARRQFELLKTVVSAALNWIIEKLNGVIDGINRVGGAFSKIGIDAPDIPQIPTVQPPHKQNPTGPTAKPIAMHTGGLVGRDMTAFLQRGERVLSAADARRVGGAVPSGGEPARIANITINSTGGESDEGAMKVARVVMRMLREELGMETLIGPRLRDGAFSPRRA